MLCYVCYLKDFVGAKNMNSVIFLMLRLYVCGVHGRVDVLV